MDKTTIGLQPNAKAALEDLMATGFFKLELDAAKFAMALAIRQGVGPGESSGTDTKWNVGTVDQSGELRELLPALFEGNSEPYRLAEYLMNEGLRLIGDDRSHRGRTDFGEVLQLAQATEPT